MTLYEFCLLVCMFYPLNDGINFFETFESIKDNFETNIKGWAAIYNLTYKK